MNYHPQRNMLCVGLPGYAAAEMKEHERMTEVFRRWEFAKNCRLNTTEVEILGEKIMAMKG